MKTTDLTFVTGNANKLAQLQQWLGVPLKHQSLDLDELQSVNSEEVVAHKAKQAYAQLQSPVLIEDVELVFLAIQPLPGPLVKWFQLPGHEALCRMLDGFEDRRAYARVIYGLYDGATLQTFAGRVDGRIPKSPQGTSGFGFDPIFIPDGYDQTRAELGEVAYADTSPRKQALDELQTFLASQA